MLEKIEEISNSLRETNRLCEYDFLIQLYKILCFYNLPILLPELNVMSGFSLRFLYNLDFQNAYNEDLDYLKSNLLENINLNLSLYEGIDLKYLIIDKLKEGFPLILHPENLLVYKVDSSNLFFFRALFMDTLPLEEVINKNKRVITVETIPSLKREEIYDIKKFSKIATELFNNFFTNELIINGVQTFIGENAYLNFINDLRDENKHFDGMRRDWFFVPSYAQWTSLYGLLSYFLGIYHFLNIKNQKVGTKIIKSLEDTILYWKDWGRFLGREAHLPPAKSVPISFRRIGANMLEKALKSLRFAINNMKYII